jgi:hypothetical protein
MLTSRFLLALTLMLIIAGSLRASERPQDKTSTPKKVSHNAGSGSSGGGFVLHGTLTPCETQAFGGDGIQLAGSLTMLAPSPDDADDESAIVGECPDRAIEARPKASRFDRLTTLLGQWGMCDESGTDCEGDLDGDGLVGATDLCLLLTG